MFARSRRERRRESERLIRWKGREGAGERVVYYREWASFEGAKEKVFSLLAKFGRVCSGNGRAVCGRSSGRNSMKNEKGEDRKYGAGNV